MGLYYLGSRYYNAEVGRFISADKVQNIGINGKITSYNLYVYCINNPVNGVDVNGECAIPAIAAAAIGGGVAGAVIGALSYSFDYGFNYTDSGFWSAVGMGALTGAIGGATGMLDTKGMKVAMSLGVGAISGVYAAMTEDGTIAEYLVAGLSAAFAATIGNSIGALGFGTSDLTTLATIFANYSTTMAVSTPSEIVNKMIKTWINKEMTKNKTVTKKNTNNNYHVNMNSKEREIRRTYGGMYVLE